MGIVHIFAERKVDPSNNAAGAANENNGTADVVQLVPNAKLVKGVPAKPIYKQMEAMLVSSGLNLSCPKNISDFKMLTYLVQGMFDRDQGDVTGRSVFGEAMRFAFSEPVDANDTESMFGDLLGQID